jgi:hypothetical protein
MKETPLVIESTSAINDDQTKSPKLTKSNISSPKQRTNSDLETDHYTTSKTIKSSNAN